MEFVAGAPRSANANPRSGRRWRERVSQAARERLEREALGPLRAGVVVASADDLIPDKGQFRSPFRHPLSYCCPATIFRDVLAAFWQLRAVKERLNKGLAGG